MQIHVLVCVCLDCSTCGAVTTVNTNAALFPADATLEHPLFNSSPCPPPTHTWTLIMSLLLLSGMSMGASTVLRLSGSAWNWLRVVALPSWTLLVLDTLKLEVRLLMNVVLPRPLSPVCSRGGWKGRRAAGKRGTGRGRGQERRAAGKRGPGRGQGSVEGRPVRVVALFRQAQTSVCLLIM